mgnify:CR=1 FL=1
MLTMLSVAVFGTTLVVLSGYYSGVGGSSRLDYFQNIDDLPEKSVFRSFDQLIVPGSL